MQYLIDTNVLLRFVDRQHPLHVVVRNAIRKLRQDAHVLQATGQNFIEFWNVATRPAARNGFGLTPNDTHRRLLIIERLFPLLPDAPEIYAAWRNLVVTFQVSGVQVHDARLVAAMQAHHITHILTFNTTDFVRYTSLGIVAIAPSNI